MKQNSYLTKYDVKKTIAMAADIYFEDINKKKDSLSFYDAKEIKFNGKKNHVLLSSRKSTSKRIHTIPINKKLVALHL